MRSLIEIRARRARLEDELGAELEAEKQAEAAAALPLHPAQRLAFDGGFTFEDVPAKDRDADELYEASQRVNALFAKAAAKPPSEVIPQGDRERKLAPMYRGLLGYFPAALFRVAEHSMVSDRKHNPNTPENEAPHWARQQSSDHADCIVRHLAEMHTNPDYHLKAIAWRALALLQEHEERKGAAMGASAVIR